MQGSLSVMRAYHPTDFPRDDPNTHQAFDSFEASQIGHINSCAFKVIQFVAQEDGLRHLQYHRATGSLEPHVVGRRSDDELVLVGP
jgi:hypothetical protein